MGPKILGRSRQLLNKCFDLSTPKITLPQLHYGEVVFALKVVFYTCMQMHNAMYIFFHYAEFYFWFRQPKAFPVWGQLYCDCQGEQTSAIFSGNIRCTLQWYLF